MNYCLPLQGNELFALVCNCEHSFISSGILAFPFTTFCRSTMLTLCVTCNCNSHHG